MSDLLHPLSFVLQRRQQSDSIGEERVDRLPNAVLPFPKCGRRSRQEPENTLTSPFCKTESILLVVLTKYNTPLKVVFPQVLPFECVLAGDPGGLHFGKREVKAILLERANSRRWGSKGSCMAWSKSEDRTQGIAPVALISHSPWRIGEGTRKHKTCRARRFQPRFGFQFNCQ